MAVDSAVGVARTVAVVHAAFCHRLPRLALGALVEAVRGAGDPLSVAELARRSGKQRRSFYRHLRLTRFPLPGALLAWGRILASSGMLDDGTASIEAVALALGMSDGAALVHLYRHHLGVTPGEVRTSGGLAFTISALQGLMERDMTNG